MRADEVAAELNRAWPEWASPPPKRRSDAAMRAMRAHSAPWPQITASLVPLDWAYGTLPPVLWAAQIPYAISYMPGSSPAASPVLERVSDPTPGLHRLAEHPRTAGRPSLVLAEPSAARIPEMAAHAACVFVLTCRATAGALADEDRQARIEVTAYRNAADEVEGQLPNYLGEWFTAIRRGPARSKVSDRRPAAQYQNIPVTLN